MNYENIDLNKIDVLAKLLSVNKRADFISFKILSLCYAIAFYLPYLFRNQGPPTMILHLDNLRGYAFCAYHQFQYIHFDMRHMHSRGHSLHSYLAAL